MKKTLLLSTILLSAATMTAPVFAVGSDDEDNKKITIIPQKKKSLFSFFKKKEKIDSKIEIKNIAQTKKSPLELLPDEVLQLIDTFHDKTFWFIQPDDDYSIDGKHNRNIFYGTNKKLDNLIKKDLEIFINVNDYLKNKQLIEIVKKYHHIKERRPLRDPSFF